MENALCRVHTMKDVFSLRRAGIKAKAMYNTLRTELVQKGKVDDEANAETWMLSNQQREISLWWDYI